MLLGREEWDPNRREGIFHMMHDTYKTRGVPAVLEEAILSSLAVLVLLLLPKMGDKKEAAGAASALMGMLVAYS